MKKSKEEIMSSIKNKARSVLPKSAKLVLFGSQARGDSSKESDWDILLLLKTKKTSSKDFDRYAYPFVDLGWSLGEYFSMKMYTFSDWAKRKGTPFYNNIEKEGINIAWN